MPNADGLYSSDKGKYIYPDQLSFTKEPFATVVPHRSTAFKVHKTEGLANSALSHHMMGAKYKQENGVWIKTWEFGVPDECEDCNTTLVESRDRDDTRYHRNDYDGWLRDPLFTGSSIFAPFLCRSCYEPKAQRYADKRRVLDDRARARYQKQLEERAAAKAAAYPNPNTRNY